LFSNAQNFVISGGAFNVTNITQVAPATSPGKEDGHSPGFNLHGSPDFPKIPLGEIDLQREICLDTGRVVRNPVRRIYSARVRGCQSNMTVAIYQGVNAEGVRPYIFVNEVYLIALHRNGVMTFLDIQSLGE
jgi:hypothetical protein